MPDYCISQPCQTEYHIKRSRFIAVIAPCRNLEEVQGFLAKMYSQHPQASHVTFAWRLLTDQGLRERFSDAGEPSGTAGRPILAHLQGKELVNCCLAVIRYFGGIKLGAGGLARAYGQAARQVLEIAQIHPHIVYRTMTITIDYPAYQTLAKRLEPLGVLMGDAQFGSQVEVTLQVPENQWEQVKEFIERL